MIESSFTISPFVSIFLLFSQPYTIWLYGKYTKMLVDEKDAVNSTCHHHCAADVLLFWIIVLFFYTQTVKWGENIYDYEKLLLFNWSLFAHSSARCWKMVDKSEKLSLHGALFIKNSFFLFIFYTLVKLRFFSPFYSWCFLYFLKSLFGNDLTSFVVEIVL